MNLISIKSPNYSKKSRNKGKIKFLIIHYTGMQSTRASINRLINPKHKVSCHYLIDRKGKIFQMVKDDKIAWHAGKSKWQKLNNLNDRSIGIELVNKGHKFGYQKFPTKQITILAKLCIKLKKKYKIKDRFVLGHSDIAPLRKIDPGEKFPWSELKKRKIGIRYSSSKKNLLPNNFNIKAARKFFFKNLYEIGYRYFNKNRSLKTDKLVIKSFQRRFRQRKINGKIDLECLKISANLAKNS